MRDRLIELIKEAKNLEDIEAMFSNIDALIDMPRNEEYLADYLLANGVIVPPCKVGDKVYEFGCNDPFVDPLDLYVVESTVSDIAIFTSEDIHNMNCLGKTVFLTKEEAEEKLKELNDNANDTE